MDYSVDIEKTFDKVYIYSIDPSGSAQQQIILTGHTRGTLTSLYKNGKMKIEFITDATLNCFNRPSISGFKIDTSADVGKHSQAFDYDRGDRIIQIRDTVENTKVFVRKTEYDALGRVSTVLIRKETYIPVGITLPDTNRSSLTTI